MKEFVKSITSPYEKELIETRRYLHRHPELSFQETDTAAYIRSTLNALGVPLMEGISGTSTVAVIKGEKTGPCIAFRADIDALPVEEENDLPFKSEVPGVMHACGHDIHTAVLLTFAKVLTAHPELVRGTVKLIFQAAEEKLPGGAKALCEEGAMIGIYEVKIHGKGGHGGYPQNALNPVPVACMVGSALNQILAEKKNPLEGGVLTVSYINGGQYPNIITDTVTLGGNVRTLNNDLIDKVFDSIHSISRGICAGFGLTCDVTTTLGYPAAINVPEEIETVRSVTRDLGYTVYERPDALGGEDFAYYLLEKPGAYFQIGMADPERPITSSPHHNCHFQLDERGISEALEMELGLYLRVTGQM